MAFASRRISLLLFAVSLLSLTALTGCNGFFVYPGSSSSTTSSSNDFVYVSNSASGSNYINGYSVSGGSLVATTGSPYSLGFIPSAMVVTEANTYLYVASSAALSGVGEIYGYSIGTGGTLTILNSSLGLEAENSSALDVSPDGQWLFSLNSDGLTMEEYKINTSTGFLTAEGNYPITGVAGGVVTPNALKIAPSGNYIAAALGTGGVDVFAFNTTTGVASSSAAVLPPVTTASGFYAVAIDASNNLYIAGTSGLVVYTVAANSSGSVTATLASSTNGYTLGTGNVSVSINKSSGYVFAGSENGGTSSTIYSYAIGSGGALTAVGTYNAPTDVAALGYDNTGDYLLAAGYSSTSGTQLFTIGSGGALTSTGSTGDGSTTTIPTVLAATH
jgi:6-phosphogluconolactonase (cycloisomerase 2 family)